MTEQTQQSNMFAYLKAQAAKPDGWVPYDAAANGASNFDGDPQCEVRIDFVAGKIYAAEYRQRAASFDIAWGFTEHAFILEGEVTITDLDTGKSVTYGCGDGWMIKAGSRTRWAVKTENFRKSGFLVLE